MGSISLAPPQKQQKKQQQQQQQQQPMITWLSAMWFCLCASLVHKYNDLIGVFFAFVGCFVVAYLLKPTMATATATSTLDAASTDRHNNNNNNNSKKIEDEDNDNNNEAATANNDTHRRSQQGRTKDLVGLVACTVSFWCLGGGTAVGEYPALSVSTGYLAFDLWYSAMNDCYPIPPPIYSILQDAITLSAFLVSLVSIPKEQLPTYHAWILGWVTYKTIVFVLHLATNSTTSTTATLKQSSVPTTPPSTASSTASSTPPSTSKWTVHGVEYDLTDFVQHHPGGKEAVALGRGRDCTALFESYHPFTNKHRLVLKKYQSTHQKSTPNHDSTDPFYNVLKERVAAELRRQGLDPEQHRTAPPLRVAYYVWIAACLVVSGYAHCQGSIMGSFLFGVFGWFIGAMGHDAGHFSASRSATLNDAGVWGMSLLCNPIMWQHQHTYAHHSHTNEFDADPDLHHFHLLLRVHKRVQQQGDFYKNQRYWPFVFFSYTFVVFGTCFWIPLDMLRTGFLYGIVEYTDRHRPLRAFGTIAHMVLYVAIVMIVPFWTSSSWYKALASVILHLSTSGLLFGIFSQINHLNEASLDADSKTRRDRKSSTNTNHKMLQNSWAAAQVETSNNFAPNSHLWHILSNGLNLQIEHHLFPSLNHSHLHRIAPVVEQTCHEYGVNYKCYRSWPAIMTATLNWMNQLAPSELEQQTQQQE